MSIAEVVDDIISHLQSPGVKRLEKLSGLDERERAEFAAAVKDMPLPLRKALSRRLADFAEDDALQDFDAVFTVFLDDPDPAIRRLSVESLWETTDWTVTDKIIDLLRNDTDLAVRGAAATLLGRFALEAELSDRPHRQTPIVDQALLGVAGDPSAPTYLRRRALEAISPRSIPDVASLIRSAYRSGDRDLRLGAIYAMGKSCDVSWLPEVLAELKEEDPERRFEALNALGELEDPAAVRDIMPLIADSDSEVARAALAALGKIASPEAIAVLRRVVDATDGDLREAAEDALAEAEFADDPMKMNLGLSFER